MRATRGKKKNNKKEKTTTKKLKKIEEKMVLWQKEDNCTFNLEQIPAESFAVRLAKLDSLLGYNPSEFPLYSNQYLPLWEDSSIYDRFKLQGKFDSHTTGGAILHINVQDNKPLSPTRRYRRLIIRCGDANQTVRFQPCRCLWPHFCIFRIPESLSKDYTSLCWQHLLNSLHGGRLVVSTKLVFI